MDRRVMLGMTTGASVVYGFGIIWLLMGLLAAPSYIGLRIALFLAGIALGASIATLGLRASRLPRGTVSPTAEQIANSRAIGRRFGLVFGLEAAAIVLAVALLNVIHYSGYIPCAIALIVGVHFFHWRRCSRRRSTTRLDSWGAWLPSLVFLQPMTSFAKK